MERLEEFQGKRLRFPSELTVPQGRQFVQLSAEYGVQNGTKSYLILSWGNHIQGCVEKHPQGEIPEKR